MMIHIYFNPMKYPGKRTKAFSELKMNSFFVKIKMKIGFILDLRKKN